MPLGVHGSFRSQDHGDIVKPTIEQGPESFESVFDGHHHIGRSLAQFGERPFGELKLALLHVADIVAKPLVNERPAVLHYSVKKCSLPRYFPISVELAYGVENNSEFHTLANFIVQTDAVGWQHVSHHRHPSHQFYTLSHTIIKVKYMPDYYEQ